MSSPKRTYSPPLILMLKITFLGDFADKKRTYFGMCSSKRTGARFNNFKQNNIDEEDIDDIGDDELFDDYIDREGLN